MLQYKSMWGIGMSFNPLSRLRKGDSKFLEDWEYSFMSNDIDRLFKNIGLQKDKIEIIKKNLELFKKRYSHSLLELIIDEDVFKRETIELLEKEKFSFNENTLQSFLSKTSYGEEYIYNNFKYITPSNREVLYKYVFTYSKNRKKWVGFLAYSNDMETRGSFMLFLFLNYPKLISTIYPNITDFFFRPIWTW